MFDQGWSWTLQEARSPGTGLGTPDLQQYICFTLNHWSKTQFLEGHFSAEFSSKHRPHIQCYDSYSSKNPSQMVQKHLEQIVKRTDSTERFAHESDSIFTKRFLHKAEMKVCNNVHVMYYVCVMLFCICILWLSFQSTHARFAQIHLWACDSLGVSFSEWIWSSTVFTLSCNICSFCDYKW